MLIFNILDLSHNFSLQKYVLFNFTQKNKTNKADLPNNNCCIFDIINTKMHYENIKQRQNQHRDRKSRS